MASSLWRSYTHTLIHTQSHLNYLSPHLVYYLARFYLFLEGVSSIWRSHQSFWLNKPTPRPCPLHRCPRTPGSCCFSDCRHHLPHYPSCHSPCSSWPLSERSQRFAESVSTASHHSCRKKTRSVPLTLYLNSCPVVKPLTKYFHLLSPSGILPKALVSIDSGDFWQLMLAFAGFQSENKNGKGMTDTVRCEPSHSFLSKWVTVTYRWKNGANQSPLGFSGVVRKLHILPTNLWLASTFLSNEVEESWWPGWDLSAWGGELLFKNTFNYILFLL